MLWALCPPELLGIAFHTRATELDGGEACVEYLAKTTSRRMPCGKLSATVALFTSTPTDWRSRLYRRRKEFKARRKNMSSFCLVRIADRQEKQRGGIGTSGSRGVLAQTLMATSVPSPKIVFGSLVVIVEWVCLFLGSKHVLKVLTCIWSLFLTL